MGSIYILQAAQHQQSELWFNINWKNCNSKVRSLQNRIVKSVRNGEWRKAKRLCYLLTQSFSARALAVKRVTENKGKKTGGIAYMGVGKGREQGAVSFDGIVWITPRQKMQAIETISNWKGYQPKALKRIRIPKKDKSQTRPLSIPTMEDRARQALQMLALQVIAETLGDTNSYGFRNKRRCADAIDQIFKVLHQKGSSQWILEADIKGFSATAPCVALPPAYMDPPRFARYLIIDVRENHCSHISGLFVEAFYFLALMVICAHPPHHPSGFLTSRCRYQVLSEPV